MKTDEVEAMFVRSFKFVQISQKKKKEKKNNMAEDKNCFFYLE